jgi:isoquinoline 1-oxidoreductase subunit beta
MCSVPAHPAGDPVRRAGAFGMNRSRRSFLAHAGGAALILTFRLDGETPPFKPSGTPGPLDSWVCINPDGTGVIQVRKAEMGQGVLTSLAMILAEEAELDWNKVTAVQSPLTEGTGGSSSVNSSYLPLRRAGATVRDMMIAAGANRWSADRKDCSAKLSCVIHLPSGRKFSYGELVEQARQLPVPDQDQLRLKTPSEFRLIGTSIPRLDIPDKVTGKAKYGLDIRIPGMRFAVIARAPRYGIVAVHYDAAKSLAIQGVLKVFQIEPRPSDGLTCGGVVVVANSTWAAMKGREALEIQWSNSPFENGDSAQLSAQLQRAVEQQPAEWSWQQGSVASALQTAAKKVEVEYEFPFLAHATMEPMNTTIHRKSDRCEVWCPTQSPDWARKVIAQELGIPEAKVTVHTTFMGGGFGRRYAADYPTEAAQIAKQLSEPVQLVWTREDDFTNDFYRPVSRHRVIAGLDSQQHLCAWEHRLSSTPLAAQGHKSGEVHAEDAELMSAMDPSYLAPNFALHYTRTKSDVRRGAWRSVAHSFNVAVNECVIDELAHSIGQDPYTFRRNLLSRSPAEMAFTKQSRPHSGGPPDCARLLAVLDLAAQKSDWKRPLGNGQAKGIACAALYGGYLAQVSEVAVKDSKTLVNRIVTAVDCGQAINPNGIVAQIEGGILFALSAVLKEQITVKNGVIQQNNFNAYEILRLPEAPVLETFVINSHLDPGGVGEAGVPLVGASVANAVFAACGKRLRSFPLHLADAQA